MSAKITSLIKNGTKDTFELVRDQVAGILVLERDNQKALATAATLDPADWDFGVYIERANPWESRLNANPPTAGGLVNVMFDSDSVELNKSNSTGRNQYTGTMHLDCYGFAVAGSGSHGDEAAAKQAQRVARLVRNILEDGQYRYLDLRGTVSSRSVNSRTAYQQQLDNRAALQVSALRISLQVGYNEYTMEYQGQPIEVINISQALDGEVTLAAIQIDFSGA